MNWVMMINITSAGFLKRMSTFHPRHTGKLLVLEGSVWISASLHSYIPDHLRY